MPRELPRASRPRLKARGRHPRSSSSGRLKSGGQGTHVDKVDAGVLDLDEDLALGRLRRVDLAHLDHVNRALLEDLRSAHLAREGLSGRGCHGAGERGQAGERAGGGRGEVSRRWGASLSERGRGRARRGGGRGVRVEGASRALGQCSASSRACEHPQRVRRRSEERGFGLRRRRAGSRAGLGRRLSQVSRARASLCESRMGILQRENSTGVFKHRF